MLRHLLLATWLAVAACTPERGASERNNRAAGLPAAIHTPPASALAPDPAQQTFQLPSGPVLELAATGPTGSDPVSIVLGPEPAGQRVRLVPVDTELGASAPPGHSASPEDNAEPVRLTVLLTRPDKSNGEQKADAFPLTPEQQARFEAGKELYLVTCASCHQPHGNGQDGLAPPLAGSDWTVGSEERLVRIVLNGLRGPVRVKDKVFELDMPALAVLADDEIAALLTYVRREWGHRAAPVEPETVRRIREATADRQEAWTAEELLKLP